MNKYYQQYGNLHNAELLLDLYQDYVTELCIFYGSIKSEYFNYDSFCEFLSQEVSENMDEYIEFVVLLEKNKVNKDLEELRITLIDTLF